MYTDKAKIMPILVKQTGYPEKILSESFDFLVQQVHLGRQQRASPERINFTAESDDQGRQHQGRQDADLR